MAIAKVKTSTREAARAIVMANPAAQTLNVEIQKALNVAEMFTAKGKTDSAAIATGRADRLRSELFDLITSMGIDPADVI